MDIENNLFNLIIQNSFTQIEALKKLRVLKEQLIRKIFGTSPSSNSPISTELPGINQDNVYKIFDGVEAKIKSITPLTIVIPFELPDSEIIKLGQKVRQEFGNNFLLEIKYDPILIAGPAFIWKGVYKDYSIHQQIAEKHQSVLAIFKEYVR